MADKIATRQAYGEALIELVEKNDKVVVLDADLANATQTCKVAKAHPEKFYNCGIAEANMVDIAAGMSTMGLIPYCSSFAMFAAGRAYEQIRNSIAYPHFNVKICATHAGVSVGEDGGSHQCIEDHRPHARHPRHDGHLPRGRQRSKGRHHGDRRDRTARSICALHASPPPFSRATWSSPLRSARPMSCARARMSRSSRPA